MSGIRTRIRMQDKGWQGYKGIRTENNLIDEDEYDEYDSEVIHEPDYSRHCVEPETATVKYINGTGVWGQFGGLHATWPGLPKINC